LAQKSTSKLLKMIPREIRAIIMDRPILTSESQEDNDNLLLCFAETYKPKDVVQWFQVKRACVLLWEEQRMHRVKSAILETAPVMEDARRQEAILIRQYKSLAAAHPDKFDKKSIQQAIKDAKVPARIIETKAFVERLSVQETVEKLQLSNEARQRFVHEALAEHRTIEVLPEMANDNEEEPAKVITHHQDEVQDDRGDEADRHYVEEPDEEEPADEAEANEELTATEVVSADAEVEPDDANIDDEESDGSEEEAA
jgi:hypothetical protein